MPEVVADRYRLEELLGRGGMSEVWCATDLELDRRVALKLLAAGADTARFEREARAVASLGHPNVAQLYDYGEAEGRPFMVLEYLAGGTLEDRMRDAAPLPEIAAGLAHAHSRGVVHRDLKPANILFDEEGHAKLADFGIARVAAASSTITEAGTLLGTAAYMSPEQAEGATATPASDVYSFGVILYRMLTGRLPFEATNPIELLMQQRLAAPTPITRRRADAPLPLVSTASAALAKSPSERPSDGAALLAGLGLARADVTPPPTPLPEEPTRVLPPSAGRDRLAPVRSRARLPLTLAALFVLALAGAGLAYELSRPSAHSTPTPRFPRDRTTTANRHHVLPVTTASSTTPTTTGETTTRRSTTTRATSPRTTTHARPTTTAATNTVPTPTATSTVPSTTTTATTTEATTTAETTTTDTTTTTP